MAESVANSQIWFDGVDKKLLLAHTSQPKPQDGNEKTLITKKSLATLSSYAKKMYKSRDDENIKTNNGDAKTSKGTKRITKVKVSAKDTIRPHTGITDEIALDCEMVECFHNKSVLARISIVNLFGHPIYDKYVAPPAKVTDYRTRYSGVRRKDLVAAPDFDIVQKEVEDILKNRIVIGHSIHNDFAVLKLSHPPEKTRDTSEYFKYLFQGKTPSLKKLSESLLGLKIQKGEHDSVQDAQATMKLYVKERDKWNERILKGDLKSTITHPRKEVQKKTKKQKKKPLKKKIKTFWVSTT